MEEAHPDRPDLDEVLGLPLNDAALWEMSLTHRSFAFEQGLTVTNERLEFLGDAVLDLAVSHLLMDEYPTRAEGELTKTRAQIVHEPGLAEVRRGRYVSRT